MSRNEFWMLQFLVWVCVYPAVLVVSYAIEWLELDWPKWMDIAISTAITVPLIGILAVPYCEKLMAAAQGRSRAALKAEDARSLREEGE